MNRLMSKGPDRKAKVLLLQALTVVAWLAGGVPARAAEATNAPASRPVLFTFDSFRTVSDRNIFNPNRYARSTSRTERSSPSTPAARVEAISLVGLVAYEKGWFALFDGTRSEYRRSLQVGGTIGQYQVTQVTPDLVQLATGTNTFDLKVGMQMRREDEGSWFLAGIGEAAPKRIVSTRIQTRGGTYEEAAAESSGAEMLGNQVAELILSDGVLSTDATSGETQPNNDNPENENRTVAPEGTQAGDGEITDPVLRALMERRRNALNR